MDTSAYLAWLHRQAGGVADALGWSVAALSYNGIADDALFDAGLDTVAAATVHDQIAALRDFGRVHLWRAATAALAADYDFSADGGSFSRSQAYRAAAEQLTRAEADALKWGGAGRTYAVEADAVGFVNDEWVRRGDLGE